MVAAALVSCKKASFEPPCGCGLILTVAHQFEAREYGISGEYATTSFMD
jgi:hypothetical protein